MNIVCICISARCMCIYIYTYSMARCVGRVEGTCGVCRPFLGSISVVHVTIYKHVCSKSVVCCKHTLNTYSVVGVCR